jgi:probable F420-dependent oxidoreductase
MNHQRPFRFAVQPVSAQVDVLQDRGALRDAARQAEALGYDELFVPDHFGSADPFVAVMVAAEATTSLRVGTLVLNNEFHHPALVARTSATIDRLTGGRFILGCGTGYMQSEHNATGIELRPPGARVDRFAECMQSVRELLHTGTAQTDGRHVRLAIDALGVTPLQKLLPILIGGHGKRVVGVAARCADIFQFTGLTHGAGGIPSTGGFSLSDVALRARWLDEAAGDRSGQIERSVLVQATVVSDHADFNLIAKRSSVSDAVARETPFVLAGSVVQIVEKLERLRGQFGISHVVVRDTLGFAPVVAALTGK